MSKQNIRNIFITGVTGFLASHLLKMLLAKNENRLYVFIRAADNRSALRRKNTLINKMFSKFMRHKVASRIHVLRGDISKDNLGLSKKDLDKLRQIHVIYHCAAICKFNCALDAIRRVNVRGTENLLKLALDRQKTGYLENVNYVSTVYIAGDYAGTFYEREIDVSQSFNNTYEQSKFEAELAVAKYRKRGLLIDTYRPSIIIDTIPPSADGIPGLLRLLVMFTLGIFKKIPADNDTELNMVPVDIVSKAIYLISTTKNRLLNQNYHIVNPRPVKLGILLNAASNFFRFKKLECIPIAKFPMRHFSPVQHKIIEPFIPYLNQRLSFNMRNAASLLKQYDFTILPISKEAVIKAFEYYRSSGILPKKGCSAIKK